VEVTCVQDPAGLRELIGPLGGEVLARGGVPVEEEAGFATLVIERWPSEGAFHAWLASEAHQPLRKIRLASATMRVIVPIIADLDALTRSFPVRMSGSGS
jgi:uncharacterized protein (DUF1330 family)